MSDITNPNETDPLTRPDVSGTEPARMPSDVANEQAHLEEERRIRATQQADEPARIRDEIRMTRTRMDDTLYELEDRVAPSRVAERSKARMKARWTDLRSNVMGSVDDRTPSPSSSGGTSSSSRGVGDVASDAADQARQAPQQVKQKTRGNPLAAGMIAFGVGALVSALLPESDQEQQLVEDAADKVDLQQVRGEVEQAAQDVREPVRERSQEGMEDLKQTASDHASELQDEAQTSQQRVASDAKADTVARSTN